MPSLLDLLKDPNYTNANEATKLAIFNKYSALDPNFINANADTQDAIKQRFGVFGEPAAPERVPTAPTTLRDVGVAGASGVVGAAKSMTDFFGADNAASKALGSASTSLQGMYTPERQKEMQYYQELQDKAAKGGDTMGEIGAAFQGIKAAPLQGTVQAVGSLIPNLATLLLPGAGQARALQISRSAINTALGIVQGTGAIKGSLYEGVKQELIKNGVDEATAAKQASEAQSYLGPNYDQILLGAGIGYGAGKLGAEELLSPAVKGAARKAAAVASEAGTEALQGGQEQVAQNLGLTRAGMETPMFQGVAGAATQEGILGALGAGPVTMLPSRTPEKPKEEPLLLEYNFKPTPLPDGRVAMTRSELDQYEEEQFRKKYETQPYERGNALAPDGSDPLRLEYDFKPTPLPDGTVAMTRSEVDAYLRRKREDEVNAPKRPELLDIIDKINARIGKQAAPVTTDGRPAMPTDTELNYATATQEVELLKKQKKTKERDARIAELEAFKQADGIAHFNRIARIDPKDAAKALNAGDISAFDYNRIIKSNQLREQMLSQGMDTDQSNQSANLFMQQTDRENLLKDYSPEIVEAVTPALNEIQELEAQRAILESSKAKKGKDSLWNVLSNPIHKLSESEINALSGKQNQYFALRAKKGKGRNLRDLVSEDTLDDFLPADLRSNMGNDLNRINAAVDKIKERIATQNFARQDTDDTIEQLDRDIGLLGEEIEYHLSKQAEPEVQQEEPDFTDLGEFDTGTSYNQDEYYPDNEEATNAPIAAEPIVESTDIFGALPAEQLTANIPTDVSATPTEGIQTPSTPEDTGGIEKPKYMEAKRGEKGMSKADVDVAVDRIKQTWENAPDIEVVQKISELPEEIQADIERDKVNPRGVYDPDTKKVWLVADNIPNDAQAAITLAHESFGHFGLRVALGKNFKPMMNSIYEGNKDVRSRADAYINDGMDKVTAVEEVLSEMAQEVYDTRVPENKNKLNILQRVMNAVRQFLARIGVPMKSISDAQVLALIANARRSVVRGGEFVEMEGGKALYSVKDRAQQAAAKATAAIHKAGQRRRMDEGLLSDLPEHLQAKARKTFTPENETIVTKVNGLQDKFWQKMAQGIVDQYRTIKDYTSEGYMLARMSKTIDGALEGMLFHGQAFLNGGALDIKSGTKGLLEIMAPLGKDVDRYQMWVALNREADITKKSQVAMQDIEQAEKDIARLQNMKGNAGKAFDKETKNILDDKELSSAKKRDALSSLRKKLDSYKNNVDKAISAKRKEIAGFKNRIKAPSIDAELVAERDKFAEGMIDGRPKLEVYREVQREMNKLNRSVLNIALEQGLINKEAYDIFASDINYIPFYKMMEDGDLQGAATASGLGSQYFSKALEGGEKPFGDLMENTLRNWSHILSASMKNKAAAVTLEAASEVEGARPNLKVGLEWVDGKVYSTKTGAIVDDGSLKPEYTTSEGKGIIKVMIDGQPTYYKVLDDLLLDSVASIGYMGPKSKFLDVARDFKNILQFGVTISPGFKVRNLFRDSIQAMAVSGLKLTPWANIVEGWANSDRNNPAHISALAGGAIFNFGSAYEGDQSRMVKQLIKMGVARDSILDSDNRIKAGLMKAWSAYTDLGNKSESANRMALYKQMRDKGMSHLEASFHARDLMDFSMQGSFPALRMVTQVVPFLNARLQGLYKLGRDGIIPTSRVIYNSTTGKPIDASDKMKAQQFSIVTGAVMLASMALYLAFKDDEEFKKREEWDRDNFWWFRLPGMDSAVRIPKPFEIGAFGTMAERLLEQMIDQGAEGKQFEESIKRMLSDTFAMNPTPQLIKPMIDLYANKDSFTGAPIETAGMERLSKAERASDNTSPLAIALSGIQRFVAPKSMEMSPVQVDYAIKSYFGWLGGTVAASSHYAVMPFSKGAYPDHNWTETASMGFIKSLPATQSKYVTAFYENNKQISQAYADMRHYAELGDQAMVAQILEEKGDLIGLQKFYDRGAKDMAKLRQAITAIRNDETMSGEQKKEEIDRLKVIIGTVAEQLESVRKSIKK